MKFVVADMDTNQSLCFNQHQLDSEKILSVCVSQASVTAKFIFSSFAPLFLVFPSGLAPPAPPSFAHKQSQPPCHVVTW